MSEVLSQGQWQARREKHRARLAPFVNEHLARRARREKHPVWDFLFEYYGFKPSLLMKWSPGLGPVLEGDFDGFKELARDERGAFLDAEKFPRNRCEGLRLTLHILESTAARPARFACFGLHEWAMVYRQNEHRHAVPLRLSDDAIARLVESQTVCCSHFDAFRFFTPAARPLNVLHPQNETRAAFEQPGCLHANLDLYKWASKFYPWIGSDLIADAFELAIEARELDMRAAPYDLAPFGFEPIPLETEAGRHQYAQTQREIADKAVPVRGALIAAYRALHLEISRQDAKAQTGL